jgi:nuclear pore complex protein Nup62
VLIRTTPADQDREKAYHIAEMLNSKLDDMTSSLSVVINELNATKQNVFEESPITNIVQILNDHLTCLEWIEKSSGELESKLEKLRGVQDEALQVQERIQKNLNR